jgi:DNA-binding GntR family transcriptional regulator
MIVKKSLVDQVYAYVISGIHSREFKPGDRLIIEDLAKRLGVSRTPIREAIGKLGQDGYIYIEHNVGPRVVEYNKKQISDLSETNSILFRGVMRRIFLEADIEVLTSELRGIVNIQEKALKEKNVDLYHESSVEFHKAILRACPNEKLKQITLQNQDQIDIYVSWYFQDEEIKKSSVREHERLLSLMENKNYDKFIVEFDKHNEMACEYFNSRDEVLSL